MNEKLTGRIKEMTELLEGISEYHEDTITIADYILEEAIEKIERLK